jgi:hypothetical protein
VTPRPPEGVYLRPPPGRFRSRCGGRVGRSHSSSSQWYRRLALNSCFLLPLNPLSSGESSNLGSGGVGGTRRRRIHPPELAPGPPLLAPEGVCTYTLRPVAFARGTGGASGVPQLSSELLALTVQRLALNFCFCSRATDRRQRPNLGSGRGAPGARRRHTPPSKESRRGLDMRKRTFYPSRAWFELLLSLVGY